MSSFSVKTTSRLIQKFKPSVPDKLKGGRLERIGNYFYNIFSDYRVVFYETLQDIKDRPIKASIYGSLIATGIGMVATNPSEQSFKAELIENANKLSVIGEPIRNRLSDNHIDMLTVAMKDGRLKIWNLKFFTLISLNEFPTSCKLYEANCSEVKPHWTERYKSIIDIGIFSKWLFLERAMKDYDVNPDEWLPDGRPKNSYRLLPPD